LHIGKLNCGSATGALPAQASGMKIDERFTIPAPIDRVWAFIRNPDQVAPCIPGCTGVEMISPTSYRSTIAVTLGPISARFNLVVQIVEEQPPTRLVCQTKGEEGTRASMVTASSEIVLTAVSERETEIHCTSDMSIVGRLGKFGLGIMKKRATQLAAEFAASVRERMQAVDA
jgi:carbon monoxide dehydrogenase subunit G